jgi:hypothetical protein
MSEPNPITLLRSLTFLREVDETILDRAAQGLVVEEYAPGQIIAKAGTICNGLYLIHSGSIERQLPSSQGEGTRQNLIGGDIFGALELVHGRRWAATYMTTEATRVYLWKRREATDFFQKQPAAMAGLRFAARSQSMADALRYSWLGENEIIDGLSRKHPALLIRALVVPVLLLLAAGALVWWGSGVLGDPMIWLASGVGLIGVLYGIWQWLDWGNDYYLVTNRRVVRLEKVIGIYDSRREAPLHNVLSISVSTTMLGRLLGYGDVVIRTFTGQIIFPNIDNPYAMASVVEKHWRRVHETRVEEDRESKVRAIRRLTDPQSAPEPEIALMEDEASAAEAQDMTQVGLGRWTFQVRFEEQGIITYRKHWAVLMREAAIPSAAIILLAGLLGAQWGGLITLLPMPTLLQISGVLILGFALYWVYKYVDWANDIYQITPTQIVDVHRKPLARELRKVAPLESILGTEVDRKGAIGLLLNYGDVISTIGTEQFVFEGVFDPVGVQQEIVRALEAVMERKQELERQKKRDEMVEWLGVYHDEYNSRKQDEQRGKGE